MKNGQPAVTLVEALEKPTRNDHKRLCLLGSIRASLDNDEQVALDRALLKIKEDTNSGQRKVYSSSWLSSVLTTQGYSLSSATIQRHLRETCGCYQTEDNQ